MAALLQHTSHEHRRIVGCTYWHKNHRCDVVVTAVRPDHNGVWYSYVGDGIMRGECFAALLLVRGEEAAALGFESDEAMREHQAWLENRATAEYHAWAAQFRPANERAS